MRFSGLIRTSTAPETAPPDRVSEASHPGCEQGGPKEGETALLNGRNEGAPGLVDRVPRAHGVVISPVEARALVGEARLG